MAQSQRKKNIIQVKVNLQGQQEGDQIPEIALYRLGIGGEPVEKIAVVENNVLNVPRDLADKAGRVALGPHVEEFGRLDKETLLQYSSERITQHWQEIGYIDVPRLRWHPWWPTIVCLSGNVKMCWLPLPVFPGAPLFELDDLVPGLVHPGQLLRPSAECAPLCNGIVEIHERVCCCHSWDVFVHIPERIRELIPVPFPGPYHQIEKAVKKYQAFVEPNKRIPLPTRVVGDLNVLANMDDHNTMIEYIDDRPYLLPLFCGCTSKQIGETSLDVDGTFDFCYPRSSLAHGCSITYFYKVKQLIGDTLVTIYDGEEANAYFTADQIADLTTYDLRARTCPWPPPPVDPDDIGRPFVILEKIGTTKTHRLHSPRQSSETSVPVTASSGLMDQTYGGEEVSDCPLGGTLQLLLWIHPGMRSLDARYYRFSLARFDDFGEILPATLQKLTNSVSWDRWAPGTSPPVEENVALGPVDPGSVGGKTGLIKIPYYAESHWLGVQYHYALNTTTLDNGRYMLLLELFDGDGNRLRPTGSTDPDPSSTDVTADFDYVHWGSSAADTSIVTDAQLLHVLHINNNPCYVEIEYLQKGDTPSREECQFLEGEATDQFRVGYRAYHREGFMWKYGLSYKRGLTGEGPHGTGALASGTANQPMTMDTGPAALSPVSPMPPDGTSFGHLLGDGAHQKCTFLLTLSAFAKHTNGERQISAYNDVDRASFALDISSSE